MHKVLLIIAVLILTAFTATLALAQPTEKASGEKTGPIEKAAGGKTNPPVDDNTPPVITIANPDDGATYDQNDPLVADYGCRDGGGSILPPEKCVGPVGNGAPLDMSPGYHNFTVKATGNNGRQTSTTHGYMVEDAKAEITMTMPADGATYDQNDALIADFGCRDGDGTALPDERCIGPVDDGEPLDMSPGYHNFTVKATDNDGRRSSVTHGYTVEEGTDENDSEDDDGPGGSDDETGGSNDPEEGGDESGGGDDVIGDESGGGGDTFNVFISSIGDTTTNVVGSIGDVPDDVAGSVDDTVESLKQGRLPDTGGGWTVLLFSGGALISGGWLMVRRFSR